MFREAGKAGYLYLLLGIASGLANAGILRLIDSIVGSMSSSEKYTPDLMRAGIYAGLIVVLFTCQRLFAGHIIGMTQTIIFRIRLNILDDIRKAAYADFKGIGRERIYTSLTQDTERISAAAASVVYATTSLVTVLFCLGYLAYVSLIGFGLTLGVIALGVLIYWMRQKRIHSDLSKARDLQNSLFRYIDELLHGFKEIKVNAKKNNDLFENHIAKISGETKGLSIRAITSFIDNSLTGQFFFFLLIGFILFVLPVISPGQGIALSYIFIVLYIMGPIEALMAVIPAITQADIAIDRINAVREQTVNLQESRDAQNADLSGFSKIVFDNVSFSYPGKSNDSFGVGPINFTIKKGDLLFIAGGNGSGKTTFFKLLTGLFYPQQGTIIADGKPVTDHNAYRALFAPIYSDFHLFRHFYGMKDVDPARVQELLKLMQLDHKVTFANGEFSQTSLSTGQRKRLALIISILEDRPIIVLDEWAADQDPHFRQFFYEDLLPGLRAKGKTVIAITHDDRFFHLADKLYKMEYGQFKEVNPAVDAG